MPEFLQRSSKVFYLKIILENRELCDVFQSRLRFIKDFHPPLLRRSSYLINDPLSLGVAFFALVDYSLIGRVKSDFVRKFLNRRIFAGGLISSIMYTMSLEEKLRNKVSI